jgi:hypothetical protein
VVIPGRTELRAVAVCVLSLAATLDARAERVSPALVVTRAPGAEDCPDAAGIVTRVRAMTQGDPFTPAADGRRDTWLELDFAQTLAGYRAVITARGRRQGTRSIEDVGPGCASLADAVTITVVMLLDPEVAAAKSVSDPNDLPVPPKDETPASPARVAFGAEAAGGVVLGVLQHGGPFVEAGARLKFARSFAFALGGGFVFPDHTLAPPGRVSLELWYGYARFSGTLFEHAGTHLALFLGPSVGVLGGSSDGFDYRTERHLLWVAGAFGVEAFALLSGPFSWSARLSAVTPFRYEGFYVSDAGEPHRAFRTPGIGGALSLGVSVMP